MPGMSDSSSSWESVVLGVSQGLAGILLASVRRDGAVQNRPFKSQSWLSRAAVARTFVEVEVVHAGCRARRRTLPGGLTPFRAGGT